MLRTIKIAVLIFGVMMSATSTSAVASDESEGKPQLYGTQFTLHAGKVQPRPIDDEAHVDQRRAKVGLRPLATYAKELEELFGGKADKRL